MCTTHPKKYNQLGKCRGNSLIRSLRRKACAAASCLLFDQLPRPREMSQQHRSDNQRREERKDDIDPGTNMCAPTNIYVRCGELLIRSHSGPDLSTHTEETERRTRLHIGQDMMRFTSESCSTFLREDCVTSQCLS